MKEQIKLHRWR